MPTDDAPTSIPDLRDREIERLTRELAKHTDDTCYGRCDNPSGILAWFQFETRGLLDPEEAHEVLDMLLNKIRAGNTP